MTSSFAQIKSGGSEGGTTGQKGRGERKKETRDSETVVVTAGNWRNFAEGKLVAVIKSGSFVVPVESRPQPISPWISPLLERLDGRGGGWNYEKSLEQESDSDWPEEQTRRPAKNNLLNALSVRAIVPDKTTDVYIYMRFKAGRRKRGSPLRNLARFAFKGERLDRER